MEKQVEIPLIGGKLVGKLNDSKIITNLRVDL